MLLGLLGAGGVDRRWPGRFSRGRRGGGSGGLVALLFDSFCLSAQRFGVLHLKVSVNLPPFLKQDALGGDVPVDLGSRLDFPTH